MFKYDKDCLALNFSDVRMFFIRLSREIFLVGTTKHVTRS